MWLLVHFTSISHTPYFKKKKKKKKVFYWEKKTRFGFQKAFFQKVHLEKGV